MVCTRKIGYYDTLPHEQHGSSRDISRQKAFITFVPSTSIYLLNYGRYYSQICGQKQSELFYFKSRLGFDVVTLLVIYNTGDFNWPAYRKNGGVIHVTVEGIYITPSSWNVFVSLISRYKKDQNWIDQLVDVHTLRNSISLTPASQHSTTCWR
jgi:hypothetical protein